MTDPKRDDPQYWTPPTYSYYDYRAAYPGFDPVAAQQAAEMAARTARRRRRIGLAVAGAAVVTATALGTSAALGAFDSASLPQVAAAAQGGNGSSSTGGNGIDPFGSGNGFGFGGSGSSAGSGSATAAQQVGVVDIDTVLGYQNARAAGTGMVLTSNGEILTNNHVVNGATKISVTVVATGKTYSANVVGTDASDDVAVLQLQNASGLATVKTADSSNVQVSDQVTGVGNAGGSGGTPSASEGSVTGLNQTITASDENGTNAETLTGMIETDADIQAGDSGGPLFNSSDRVVGMDSAASNGQGGGTDAYAIPINKALAIADQIEKGQSSSSIHIGETPFLGIELGSASSFGQTADSATIAGVVQGSPAAQAGLSAGDTITSFGGTAVDSASTLSTAIAQHKVGDQVSISWTDSAGGTHSATVTLVAGPAA